MLFVLPVLDIMLRLQGHLSLSFFFCVFRINRIYFSFVVFWDIGGKLRLQGTVLALTDIRCYFSLS